MQAVQPAVIDTATYYHAAYVLAALLYGGYAASLWVRARRVQQRLRATAAWMTPGRRG